MRIMLLTQNVRSVSTNYITSNYLIQSYQLKISFTKIIGMYNTQIMVGCGMLVV